MARTTTNYGWNISEGTDLVNPLTDIFPNFESQDTDLKNVSDCSIGTATELKTGTVHALTRDDSDKDVFKFTATSNFTAGDTFTVDGDQVSALTTAGEQLQTGCYIIGSEVLVLKKGTLLTMYVSTDNAITLEGHSASYFATASDLSNTDGDVSALSTKVGSATLTTTAPDLSGAVNELNSNLSDRTPFIDIPAKSGNNVSEFIGAVSGYLYSQGYNTGTYTFHCLWTDNYQTHGQIQFLSNGGQYAIIEIAGDLYTMNYTPNVSRDIYRVNHTQI